MAEKKPTIVNCKYQNCCKIHETTELLKENAVQDGRYYFHPDCYHTMKTVNEIKDLFYRNINPLMTKKQIAMLVSTVYKIIFDKQVDVDFLKFALQFFIKEKPGKLHQPFGLYYIIQDRDVTNAWKREQDRRTKIQIQNELKKQQDDRGEIGELDLNTPDGFVYKQRKARSFADILQ